MIVILRFDKIPISGNEYSNWIGPGGKGKRLIRTRVRFAKGEERWLKYPTHEQYLNSWRILCLAAWQEAGEPRFKGAILVTPKLWRWNKGRWYDNGNTIQALKPIVDMFTEPIEKKTPKGWGKFGLGMVDDDRHNQVYLGHPQWLKPDKDDDRSDRMILIVEDYEPTDQWEREKFIEVWNTRKLVFA
jgi:hypothetical protein